MTAAPARLSAVDLSLLIRDHTPVVPKPCTVCGCTDMTLGGSREGITRYVCEAAIREQRAAPGLWSPERDVADLHYRRSEQHVGYIGDPRVLTALYELRELRAEAGGDMTVPVGEITFPNGHGQHRCYQMLRHDGGDRWSQHFDWDYTHNPAHATMEHEDDVVPAGGES